MAFSFVIPISDLKSGASAYSWSVDNEFFEEFENEQIRAAELAVKVVAQKTGASISIDLEINGTLTVPCDRCLGDVEMPVEVSRPLKVRFGQPSAEDADEEDGRELVWLPVGETEIDLAQTIYDYSCLSLPIQCRHRDGECDPETLKYLNPSEVASADESPADSPFAALKGLLENDK